MLSVANKPIILSVVMLNVVKLSVIMLSVVMLIVVAPSVVLKMRGNQLPEPHFLKLTSLQLACNILT
jgi:hypothetical protein